MNRLEIEKVLESIFIRRFSMDFLANPEMKDMKLLCKNGIPARELLHVYFDVKKNFSILIPEDDVAGGRFDTFDNIAEIVYEQMQTKGVINPCPKT